MDKVRVINNITKEYPDMYKILIYKEPKIFIKKDFVKRHKSEVSDVDYVPSVSSLNRTKTLVKDLVLCNNFELFATFTFNPKKVDSFSLSACWNVMSRWFSHQRNLSRSKGKKLEYICIPEQHKSGRWHFHALMSGYVSTLHDSGLKSTSLRPIFNITSFRSGFTTAVEIDSKEAVSNYITKYITKDFVKHFNQRRFFASRGLVRPVRSLNSSIFSSTLPIFRRKVSSSLNTKIDEFVIDKSDVF